MLSVISLIIESNGTPTSSNRSRTKTKEKEAMGVRKKKIKRSTKKKKDKRNASTYQKGDKNSSYGNTKSGILELFDLDKEHVLLYHLSMLENKML